MPQAKIDGLLFKEMIQSGAALLTQNRESVDALNVFPVPDGPQTTTFSFRPIHSRVRSACCVGTGIEDADSSQVSKVFPVGNPAALRLVASMDRARPVTSSTKRALMTSAGSHRWDFAVAISSGANARA